MVKKDNPNIPYSLNNFPQTLSHVKFFSNKAQEEKTETIKAFVGWDGIVIFDENIDILQTLKIYAKQYQNYSQSCGRCTPGKYGGKVLYELLEKIQNDPHATHADIDKLREICELMRVTSKCEIGKTTPKPILQILESKPHIFTEAIAKNSKRHHTESLQRSMQEFQKASQALTQILDGFNTYNPDNALPRNVSHQKQNTEYITPTSPQVRYRAARSDISKTIYDDSRSMESQKDSDNTECNHAANNTGYNNMAHAQENSFEPLQRYKSAITTQIGNIAYISKITAPCTDECPSRVDIPAYIEGVKDIRYMDSLSSTRANMPLAQVCGRVCPHPCESACRRAILDEPISIMELKRVGADAEFALKQTDKWEGYAIPNNVYAYSESNHYANIGVSGSNADSSVNPFESFASVGVIGAGPAGLSAAYYMALRGIKVEVYEALPVLGGEVAVGVPNYRMPITAYNHDIDSLKELGVVFHTNFLVDSRNIIELENKHSALVIAVGTRASKKLGCKNENTQLEGYLPAIRFMDSVNLAQKFHIGKLPNLTGKKIVCVGGGFTSMDVVRCCVRLGAQSVIMLYRRDEATIIKNTSSEEYHEACEEGVEFQFLSAVHEIIEENGRISALTVNRYELIKSETSPKGELKLIENGDITMPCDILIPAVSQEMDFPLESSFGVEISKWKTIAVDDASFSTTKKGIFAAGDCVSGPLTIVNAVGQGRRVASVVANYLQTGEVMINADEKMEDILKQIGVFDSNREVHGFLRGNMREVSSKLAPNYRAKNFEEVNFGLSREEALNEASRCMRCYYISMCVVDAPNTCADSAHRDSSASSTNFDCRVAANAVGGR
ncbi:FAD-dependent oxidoreductase [Helicobacter sp. MIT 14-3879]|uniref:FAD-dependent oxidoreductase n=1 Tax=Helicobacter sp. MIT 14-3879 TaxID=2040649 RepID=UPI002161CFFD|nr:FAD-dependent oxidoreductase [Helicobacter sp. MIT 14-3879]